MNWSNDPNRLRSSSISDATPKIFAFKQGEELSCETAPRLLHSEYVRTRVHAIHYRLQEIIDVLRENTEV
jgi:hypothetical protein